VTRASQSDNCMPLALHIAGSQRPVSSRVPGRWVQQGAAGGLGGHQEGSPVRRAGEDVDSASYGPTVPLPVTQATLFWWPGPD
jgi:hypothetical protein